MPTRRRTFEGRLSNDAGGLYLQSISGVNHRLICDDSLHRLIGSAVSISGVVTDTDAIVVFSIERL